ncbi:40-kDa huntingtin-associated protein-like [Halichondria panicea]|uniref:40-kDa huntingtin-associated protein-like n=1 Tax=Halichondria panicea TaxID=6063 RepID=UPI00312BACBB
MMSSKQDKLDHLDSRSHELFSQYRIVAGKLKKRFMKKPNVREASDDYGKLANALKNEENPQYAALCFSAMAKCDQILGDVSGEGEAWANAGRQFLIAEDILFTGGYPSYGDSLDAGVQCFLLAIEAHYKQGNEVMAAMFCLEIAHRLKHFKKFHEALTFLNRAADLQNNKPECQLQTMEEIALCKIRLREYDSALSIISKITSETKGKEGPYAVLRQRCEVCQLLLLLILQIPRNHLKAEHSQVLSKFSKDVLDTSVVGPGMHGELYVLLQSLLIAVEDKCYKEIEDIQPIMWRYLTSIQQHLYSLLMEAHNPHRQSIL